MSLLKNLIKKGISEGISNGIKEAVSGAVESAVNPVAEKWANKAAQDLDNAAGTVENNAKEAGSAFDNLKKAAENYAAAVEQAVKESGYEFDESTSSADEDIYIDDGIPAAEKIRKVLAESFPQYIVKEDVSPADFGGTGKFMNYSFAVYSGNSPRLFIMLIGRNTCSTRLYRWSKEQADRCGVQMINFIDHYPNNLKYIEQRLKNYL